MLVTSLKFALMNCYGHRILVKMCYAIVRKCIFGMKLIEFVRDIKKNVFMKGLLKNSGCHSDEKGRVCKSLKAGKSRWVSSMRKLFTHMDRSNREEQFM